MKENKGGSGRATESAIGKRDSDREIYRATHISKRARRFLTVSETKKAGK